MSKLEKIVLIEFNPVLPNSGSQMIMPRHGALAVGSTLKQNGYDVRFLYEPIFGKIDIDSIMKFNPDMVAFTSITGAISKVEEFTKKVKEQNLPILLGGEHVSMVETDFGDYIVKGEGEHVAVQLLESLNNGRNLDSIPNLRYLRNGQYVENNSTLPGIMPVNYRYDLSIVENLDDVRFFDKLRLRLPLQTTRGCPYSCNFCVTKDLLGKKYRRRNNDDIFSDIESGLNVGINSFMIVDNHFGIGEQETIQFLEKLISQGYKAKFTALVRSDIANNQKVIELMSKAGIRNVSIGIESVNDNTLRELNKEQDLEQVKYSLKVFGNYGISVLGLFMVGADHDTVDSVRRIPEFTLENQIDKIQISPLTFPPSKTWPKMFPEYRIIQDVPFDYYNGHFVTIYPLQIRPSVLQEEISKAYDNFYSSTNVVRALNHSSRRLNAFFGRFNVGLVDRLIINKSVNNSGYIDFLREKEKPFYQGNKLDKDKLEAAYRRAV